MEAETGRRLPSSNVSLYKDQSVLIFNQNASPCAADKCESLLPLLRKSLPAKFIGEGSSRFRLPDALSLTPDLIVLRPGIGEAAQGLTESCKRQGSVGFFKHKREHFVELKLSK